MKAPNKGIFMNENTENHPGKPREKTSWVKRVFLYLVLLLGLFAILLIVGIKVFFPAEKIRSMIITSAEEALNRPVTIEKISLSLLKGLAISVQGIKISNTELFGGEPLLQSPELMIKVKLTELLRRNIVIRKVSIVKPTVSIRIRGDGSSNLDGLGGAPPDEEAKKPPGPAVPVLPIPISLEDLTIDDGRLIYLDEKTGLEFTAGRIAETLSLTIDRSFENVAIAGLLHVEDISVKPPGMKEALRGLAFDLHHDMRLDLPSQILQVRHLTLECLGQKLVMKGSIRQFLEVPDLDLAVDTGTINIGDVVTRLSENMESLSGMRATGTVALHAEVQGQVNPPESPSIRGTLNFEQISLHYPGLPEEVDEITGRLAFNEKNIDDIFLLVRSGENSLKLSGKIENYREEPDVDIGLDFLVRLGEVKKFYPLPEGITLRGEAAGELTARGPVKDPFKMDVRGKFDLKEVEATSPGIFNGTLRVGGSVSINPKIIQVSGVDFRLGPSDLKLTARFVNYLSLLAFRENMKTRYPKPKLTFRLSSSNLILSDMFPEKEEEGKQDEEETSVPLVIPPISGIEVDGRVQAEKIVMDDLSVSDVRARITQKHGRINIENISLKFMDGNITGQMWMDIADTSRITYGLSCNMTDMEANNLLGFFTPVKDHLYGKLNTRVRFTGAGLDSISIRRNLRGEGNFSMKEGMLINWDFAKKLSGYLGFVDFDTTGFNDFRMGFLLENEKMFIDNLKMKTRTADIVSGGWVGLDQSLALDLNIRFTEAFSGQTRGGLLGTTAEYFKDSDGRINLDVHVGGTTSSPSFKIDTSKAKKQLEKKARDQLDSEINKLRKKMDEATDEQKDLLEKKGKKLLKKLFK